MEAKLLMIALRDRWLEPQAKAKQVKPTRFYQRFNGFSLHSFTDLEVTDRRFRRTRPKWMLLDVERGRRTPHGAWHLDLTSASSSPAQGVFADGYL